MLWYLTSESQQKIIYIVKNSKIVIGRNVDAEVCTFAIPEDSSISRKHAVFSENNNTLYIQDLGSRYGTFVNSNKVQENCKIQLKHNDVVKLGKLNSVWNVNRVNLVTCVSTLKGVQLENFMTTFRSLGGTIKSEWDASCLFLTMPAITLTIKAVLALAQGSHIVNTEYWNKCLDAVNNKLPLPNPNNFIPQIIESTLNREGVTFVPDERRKLLFDGKKIVFFSRKQLDMYKEILKKSAGVPLLLSESHLTKSTLCQDDVIIIQYNIANMNQETQAQKNQINDIIEYMKNKGKRLVADSEIGLAILYCSLSKYCNPEFNFSSTIINQSSKSNGHSTVLAPESQTSTQVVCKKENVVINESLNLKENESNSKRKLSNDSGDDNTNATKKLATGEPIIKEGGKRKFTDSTGDTNPNKKQAVESSNGDDIFNFVQPATSNKKTTDAEKKSIFSKPQKRKVGDALADEDDLFNFVDSKRKPTDDVSNSSIFDSHSKHEEDEVEALPPVAKKIDVRDNKVDIEALRGVKLKELMKNISANSTSYNSIVKSIKKEVDDIDLKMENLDLGSTIVVVKKDLIVKKEPIVIEDQGGIVKNFKKFKKVWPVKMQVTVIPRSSLSVN